MINSKKVKEFWESNPYHEYENPYNMGTKEYFNYFDFIKDRDSDKFSNHLWGFDYIRGKKVLDIGIGSTAWYVRKYTELGAEVFGVDITEKAIKSGRKALELFDLKADLRVASALSLPFADNFFDYVNSAGVLHHTGDTQKGINEVFRVLKKGGRTSISLYYKSLLFRKWFFPITKLGMKLFLKVKGRDKMFNARTPEELMRFVDGDDNPCGEMYTKKEIKELFKDFKISNVETHMFIMHFTSLPKFLHKFLDWAFPLQIFIEASKV